METAIALFGDYTLRTVAAGAILLGVTSGALGSFAVLRKQSLLGDTLSHAALPGIALGFLIAGGRSLSAVLAGALATGILAALTMLLLVRRSRLKTDASLGVALSVYFAAGVVLLSFVQGRAGAGQAGLETFLFGQAAAILRSDLWIMGAVTVVSIALVAATWKELKAATFDPLFAASLGLPIVALDAIMTAMIALAVVLGLQMVGVVLMSAMIVAPAVAARQWTERLSTMVILASTFGAVGGVVGALISATGRGLATGPLIVLSLSVITAISLAFAPNRGLIAAAIRRARSGRALRARQVLATMDRLASEHGHPDYATEQGMLDTYFGMSTAGLLRHLDQRGWVRRVEHRPEEGVHWVLTETGSEEASRLPGDEGRDDEGQNEGVNGGRR
ncbi:MAG: metal ABC transporter permease [Trueperaceae bacterium]|nr:metal ABC transporter permease [Trueperaceae bacterium]